MTAIDTLREEIEFSIGADVGLVHPNNAALAALDAVEQLVAAAELIQAHDDAGGNEWWKAHARLYAALAPFRKDNP